jgi:hypothetical protein
MFSVAGALPQATVSQRRSVCSAGELSDWFFWKLIIYGKIAWLAWSLWWKRSQRHCHWPLSLVTAPFLPLVHGLGPSAH